MDLYLQDFIDGLLSVERQKIASDLFTTGANRALFPMSTSQAKWKYAKGKDFIRLSDNTHVFHFKAPNVSQEEDFQMSREEDLPIDKWEDGATEKGLAQIHRSDPGSIYFTLQDGRTNPTYNLRHTGNNDWHASPKKRKKKELAITNVNIDSIKEGMEEVFKKKEANFVDDVGGMGYRGMHGLEHLLRSPGSAVNIGPVKIPGVLAAAGAGALAGTGYHLGKKYLYNTPEENAQEAEEGIMPALKRILYPTAALGGMAALNKSLASKYYDDTDATGHSFNTLTEHPYKP